MSNIKKNIIELAEKNVFGLVVGALFLAFMLTPGMFVKNYSGKILVFEFLSVFIYIILFGAAIFKFFQTRLTDALYFAVGMFCCLLSAMLRNWSLLYFSAGKIVGFNEVFAFSQVMELLFFALFAAYAGRFQYQPTRREGETFRIVRLFMVACVAVMFITPMTFKAMPLIISTAGHKNLLFLVTLLCYALGQVFLAACLYYGLNSIVHRRVNLIWNNFSFVLLFVSNIYFERSVNGYDIVVTGLVIKNFAFILILIETTNDYITLLKERAQYSQTVEKLIYEKSRENTRTSEAFKTLREKTIESQEASRIKSELLANMSHELRTPMNSIIGFTSRVIKKTENALPEKQIKNLRTIQRNAYHLLSLINTILDVSKIEAGRMEFFIGEFAVAPLVEEVLEMGRSLLEGKEIQLTSEVREDIIIKSDRMKVKQIIVNLVGNAIKFTEQGEIRISVRRVDTIYRGENVSPREGIAINVSDTGVGIKKEDIKYVFDDYKQVDTTLTRTTGGTGLGLALVKRFSYLLGGTVTVASEYQRGTTFTVLLPLESKEIEAEMPERRRDRAVTRTIVCCEQEPAVAKEYTTYFSKKGLEPKVAETIDTAFAMATESYPHVVTLDLMSPAKKGIDLIRKLKTNYYTKEILICAAGFFRHGKYAYFAKVLDYVTKPVDREFVSRILNSATQGCPTLEHMLLVDNDEAAIDLMHKTILQEGEYQVRLAHSLEQALHMMQKKKPDVIVLNIVMPDQEGFRIVGEFATRKHFCDIPFIFIAPKMAERSIAEFYQRDEIFLPDKGELKSGDVLKKINKVVRELL